MAGSTLRIAWRNLWRNRKRTAFALAAIGVGQLAFLLVAALMQGYSKQFLDSITGPLLGHAQVHAPAWRDERAVDQALGDLPGKLAALRADEQVRRAAPRVLAPVLAARDVEGFMAMVVGIDPAAEIGTGGLLADAGSAGGPPGDTGGAAGLGGRRVLVGRGLAEKEGLAAGDTLALVGQDAEGSIANDLFVVTGILPTLVELVDRLGVVMLLADAQELLRLPDAAHEIVLHVADTERLDETVSRLAALPALAGAEVLSWRQLQPHLEQMLSFLDAYLFIILAVVLIAAAAGIANTMLMSTFERRRELGMLLSLGCAPGRLSRLVALEAVLLGQLGVLLGTAVALAVILPLASAGLDYAALGGGESYSASYQGISFTSVVYPRLAWRDVLLGAAAVLGTSLLSALWPMLHVTRLEPVAALRT
ncbi:MAG: ABC transporter permease [Candidatus Krumholzibacteriota bacterium]|nr:ABC transporter permease [Candidatus Krumholzibacteriota bacterium]